MPLITWPQRCSHPLCSSQSTDGPAITTHREPTTHTHQGTGHEQFSDDDCQPQLPPKGHPPQTVDACSLRTQQCAAPPITNDRRPNASVPPTRANPPRDIRSGHGSGHPHQPHYGTGQAPEMLLRKEVIQPHLPVRLPCYDFVPIASPTFDGSPPKGLGHRLRVLPTFVT